jgi:hypothetical protein
MRLPDEAHDEIADILIEAAERLGEEDEAEEVAAP